MALVHADFVKETSTTTGTGTYDLDGAATGFQTFVAGVGTTNTCLYSASDGTDWETGIGTITDATPDTLARTTVLTSSNGDAAVNWGAGTKTLVCTYISGKVVTLDGIESLTNKTLAGFNGTNLIGFGTATSLEIPNSATPSLSSDGEIAVDTTVTDFSHGVLKYYGGEEIGVVSMPIAEFTTPTGGAVPTYNATNDEFEMVVPAGGGNVSNTGTPVNNQVAVWTDSTTIEGDSALTFNTTSDILSVSITGVIETGTIEVGHATDTTISRTAAGELAVEGTAIQKAGKQTIWIPANSMVAPTTSGAADGSTELATNDIMLETYDFDTAADEYVQFSIAFPKSYDLSTITFQAFWTVDGAVTTGVAWGLQAVAIADNEAIDATWGTAVVVTDDAQGAANELLVSAESGAVTTGSADDDLTYFRVFRDVSDANDDMTQDAKLIGIKLFYTTDASNDA